MYTGITENTILCPTPLPLLRYLKLLFTSSLRCDILPKILTFLLFLKLNAKSMILSMTNLYWIESYHLYILYTSTNEITSGRTPFFLDNCLNNSIIKTNISSVSQNTEKVLKIAQR